MPLIPIPVFLTYLFFGVLIAGVVAVVVTALQARRRARRLSSQAPPTSAELDEVRRLRRPGVVHLGGRSSAPARHFESPTRAAPDGRIGSSKGLSGHPPPMVRRWRDRRTRP